MPFTLNQVVPWGRSYDEYCSMFSLSVDDLAGRILGCADGPASFNAELTNRGGHIRSADPLYTFERDEIQQRIEECFDDVVAQVEQNRHQFSWTTIQSVEKLARIRRSSMEDFLAHYQLGSPGYVSASLPDLPFDDGEFDLALCSHFLFLYSDLIDTKFHVASILELCRVASEVRVFPLLDLTATRSSKLEEVKSQLARFGKGVSVERVDYEFQKGGNEMLRITN